MENPVLFMDRGMLVLRFAGCAAAFAMDEPAVFSGLCGVMPASSIRESSSNKCNFYVTFRKGKTRSEEILLHSQFGKRGNDGRFQEGHRAGWQLRQRHSWYREKKQTK